MPRKPRKSKPAKPPVERVPVIPPDAPPRLRAWLERLFAGQRWQGGAEPVATPARDPNPR